VCWVLGFVCWVPLGYPWISRDLLVPLFGARMTFLLKQEGHAAACIRLLDTLRPLWCVVVGRSVYHWIPRPAMVCRGVSGRPLSVSLDTSAGYGVPLCIGLLDTSRPQWCAPGYPWISRDLLVPLFGARMTFLLKQEGHAAAPLVARRVSGCWIPYGRYGAPWSAAQCITGYLGRLWCAVVYQAGRSVYHWIPRPAMVCRCVSGCWIPYGRNGVPLFGARMTFLRRQKGHAAAPLAARRVDIHGYPCLVWCAGVLASRASPGSGVLWSLRLLGQRKGRPAVCLSVFV
jgi:hypothetical protein